jgi:O-antigen/teichoic acid export membrane protein
MTSDRSQSTLVNPIGRNVSVLTGLRLVSTLAGLGSVIVLARAASTAEFGEIAAAYGIVNFVVAVADAGGSTLVAREMAKLSPSASMLSGIAVLRWCAFVLFFVIGAFVVLPGGGSQFRVQLALGLCMYAPAMLWTGARVAGLLGSGRVWGSGFSQAAGNVSAFILVAATSGYGSAWFFVSLAVGTWFGGAITRFLGNEFRMLVPFAGAGRAWQALREGLPISIGGFAVQALGLDVAIATRVASPQDGALIALPSRATNGLAILTTAVSQSVMVDIVASPRSWSPARLYRTTAILFSIMVIAACVLGVVGATILSRLVPDLYPAGNAALAIVLLSAAASALTTPVGGAMVGRGRQSRLASVAAFSSVCGLVVTVVGAAVAGATGAAFGRLSASMIAAVVLLRPANVSHLLSNSALGGQNASDRSGLEKHD